ncbi:hypothetical protein SDC9_191602 [bioreactor metagenome]|uniref:Uncharacterized protein n=1 Tax=bioreactor metagenome TaxID=1076179 RepID=A0A645HYB9_9ZZZZ
MNPRVHKVPGAAFIVLAAAPGSHAGIRVGDEDFAVKRMVVRVGEHARERVLRAVKRRKTVKINVKHQIAVNE